MTRDDSDDQFDPSSITFGERVRTWTVADFRLSHVRHTAGMELPFHQHDVPSIAFVLSGGYEEMLGGVTVQCVPDFAIFKPGGAVHANNFVQESRSVLIELPEWRTQPVVSWGRSPRFATISSTVAWELRNQQPGWQLVVEGAILEMLGCLLRSREARQMPAWIQDLESMVRAGTIATVAEAAARFGRSASQVARQFRRAFGSSVGDYVRACRIDLACRELAETDKTIASIALDCGFYDQSHLTRVFSQVMKMTPTEYRRTAGHRSRR